MKSIIKRNSRSVISILLTVCMLVSCMTVGLVMTDAAQTSQQSATGAKATTDETGAMINNDTANGKGAAAESGSTGASATDQAVGAKAGSDTVGVSYYLLMGSDNNPTTWTKNFSASKSGTTYTATIPSSQITQGSNFYLALSSSTNYTNEFNQVTDGSGSAIAAANKSGSGFSWNGVQSFNVGSTTYYSAGYKCSTVISGDYTVTYNSSSRVFTVTAPSETTYAVTFNSGTGGTVVAGSTTVNAGGTASVNVGSTTATTITATPSSGYTFDKWTVSGTTTSVTLGNTNSASTTVTASGAGAIITASFKEVSTTTKTIYFDNSTANWSQPYAFAWVEGGASYLGAWPGTKMTKVKGEANVWSVEVSTDAIQIIFNDGTGTTNPTNKTENLTIPTNGDNEFYNHSTSTAGQGYWKQYTKSTSSNHFEASLGTSVTNNSNLYSDINATFYDYYTNGEYNGSWYSGITNTEGWIDEPWNRNPYTQFNQSLSEYASANQIQFPMYFLAEFYDKAYHSVGYHHEGWSGGDWDGGGFINDSNSFGTGNNDTALTGLSGKTLDGNIHHYKSGAENENGAVMAMFDPDWLTSRTGYTYNNALATIVDTKFPVRKTTKGGTTTYENKIYVKANRWADADAVLFAHFYGGSGDYDDKLTYNSTTGYYECTIPSGRTKVVLVRMPSGSTSINWNTKWAQSGELAVPTSNTSAARLYTHTGTGSSDWGAFDTGDLDPEYGISTSGGQTYYTFDSTGAKDNVWFTNVSSPSSGMTLEYGAGTTNGIKNGYNGSYSFLPFDGTRGSDQKGKDLGFGMKLEIDFTLGQGGKVNDMDQVFEFSGDDDLWVFIDDQLVLDLGGAHSRVEGSINFADRTLSLPKIANIQAKMPKTGTSATRNTSVDIDNNDPNKVHTMTLYYMERGLHESNLKFGFSFTPVGNSFDAEEKIDTSSVNRGLQAAVETAAANDGITVTHKTGTSADPVNTIAENKNYTLSNDTSGNTGSTGTYSLNKDIDATFVDQFTKGNYFKLTTADNSTNVYSYDTKLVSVTDTVTNQAKPITDGNTFEFLTTKANPGELDATKIKAVFRSTLSTKNLIVTKNIASITDPDEVAEFTYKLYVDIDGSKTGYNYAQYPMTYTKNGTVYTLDASDDYSFTLKQNEVAIFSGIPEGALVKLEETDPGDYIFGKIAVKNSANADVTTTEVSGSNAVTFTLSDNDTATVSNTPYIYVLRYVYESRLWGTQSYTVSGYFTEKDFYADPGHTDGYVQLATVKDGTTGQDCTGLKFANTERQEVFLANNGPFEDNFRKVLRWRYSEAQVKYYDENKQLSVTINASEEHDQFVDIYLQIPFGIKYTDNGYQLTGTLQDGCPIKGDNQTTELRTLYETTYRLNTSSTADPIYVEVPPAIYDGGTKKYFSYWSMKDEYNIEIERCYNVKLNFVFWLEKTYATPVYDSTSYDSHQMAVVDTDFATIQWLENSRNQWNMNGGGKVMDSWKFQGDRIIADFVLSYNYQNVMLHDYADKYKTGLIIEKLDELDVDKTGSYYTKANNATEGSDNYKAIYHNKDADEGKTGATTMIKTYIDNNNKSGASGNYMISEVDTATLDNKSRIEYYYTIANIKHTDGSETVRKNYVYRAYSYLYNAKSKQVLLMSDPTYFTIYDIASIYCDAARGNKY